MDITQNHCEKQLKNILVCRVIMSYNEQEFKDNSSGRGVIPHRRYSPRPAKAADLVRFQNRQYSLDERRNCMTGVVHSSPGLFQWSGVFLFTWTGNHPHESV